MITVSKDTILNQTASAKPRILLSMMTRDCCAC